ncbi:MAG: hypothetical protein MUD01_28520 [Chloroflexaceae bacterium]|nr:hypothetical protein [Chloroflexaceae bacterium]
MAQLFTATEAALHAVEFFKGRNPAVALRTLRQLAGRAGLNVREAALLTAIAREVAAFVKRLPS